MKTIHHVLDIDAKPESVWSALTRLRLLCVTGTGKPFPATS